MILILGSDVNGTVFGGGTTTLVTAGGRGRVVNADDVDDVRYTEGDGKPGIAVPMMERIGVSGRTSEDDDDGGWLINVGSCAARVA